MMLAIRRLVEPKQEADPASEVGQSDVSPEQQVKSIPADDGVSVSPSPRLRRANAPPPLAKPLPSGGSPSHTPPHTDSPPTTHTHTQPLSHTPPSSAHAGSPKHRPPPSNPTHTHTQPPAQKHPHAAPDSTHTHIPAVPQLCLPEGEGHGEGPPPAGQRVTRSSSSALEQASVNRSQSQGFATATRPRRKSRPPTPPKRSCSSVSNSNLADEATPANDTEAEVGLLSVSYRERRRSDCGVVATETGMRSSAGGGSVRDIAAMLEMTSPLGGGATPGSGCGYLQASPELLRRQREAVTSDDLQERRRTICGPPSDLVATTTKQSPPTPREVPEPRPRSVIGHLDGGMSQEEWSRVDATATLRKPCPPQQLNQSDTSTIRRRPKPRSSTEQQPMAVEQSDRGAGHAQPIRGLRRPVSEVTVGSEGGADFRSLPRTPKPPVSPKPAAAARHEPNTPVRRVLISPEVKRVPPPVAPKPSKAKIPAHASVATGDSSSVHGDTSPATPGLQGDAAATPSATVKPCGSSPLSADTTANLSAALGDASASPSANLNPPQRDSSPTPPSPAQTPSPQTPHPVKPPRASIAGLSVDLPQPLEVELGGVEAVQQRLREVEKQREEEERKLREMERHRMKEEEELRQLEEERRRREMERQRAEEEEEGEVEERTRREMGNRGKSAEGGEGGTRRRRVGVARQEQVQGEPEEVESVAMEKNVRVGPIPAQRRLSGMAPPAAAGSSGIPPGPPCPAAVHHSGLREAVSPPLDLHTLETSPPGPPCPVPVHHSGPSETASPPSDLRRLETSSSSLTDALQVVEEKIKLDNKNSVEGKTSVSILDDIGSMFDDLAEELDAMLD